MALFVMMLVIYPITAGFLFPEPAANQRRFTTRRRAVIKR
jgi:hypothetical protein